MQISLSDTGKRYNLDWIFRRFSFQFTEGMSYAITGPNGSGKSTLLQIIAGAVTPSEGKIEYVYKDKILENDNAYRHISIAAPYLELIEEMTLLEFLQFHKKFKPLLAGTSVDDIIGLTGLKKSAHKQIRYYSSGMKQRVKLAQAFFSDTPCLMLDEPCTNLDTAGIQLYNHLVEQYGGGRTIIISSNDKQEYSFCKEIIEIMKYKW